MPVKTSKPETVEEYILGFPEEVQTILRKIRAVVCKAAPHASETISYRMPALKQNGMLIYYAAFKKHIGFYPPIKGDRKLELAASVYAGDKGNLRFPLDQPIPYRLIAQLTALRAKQDKIRSCQRKKKPRR